MKTAESDFPLPSRALSLFCWGVEAATGLGAGDIAKKTIRGGDFPEVSLPRPSKPAFPNPPEFGGGPKYNEHVITQCKYPF